MRTFPAMALAFAFASAACDSGGEEGSRFSGAEPIEVNSTTEGTIAYPFAEHVYELALPSSGCLTLTLSGLSADANLVLYTSDGIDLAGSYKPQIASESLYSLRPAETLYAVVLPTGAATPFTLTATFTPFDYNDIPEQAQAVTLPYAGGGEISHPEDEDYYTFSIPDAGRIDVQLTNLSGDADLGLHDGDLNLVAYGIEAGSTPESVSWLATAGGTWYVEVAPWAPYAVTYDLSITYTP